MTLVVSEERLDSLINRARWYFLLAVALILLEFAYGIGSASAVMAIGLAATGGSLRSWRTERGLWMLSALFLVLNGVIYCVIEYGQLRDLFDGRHSPWPIAIDLCIATRLLWTQFRMHLTVTALNRRLTST